MDEIPLRNMGEEQSLEDEDELPSENFRDFLYAQAQGVTVALLPFLCLGLPIIIGVLPNLSAVSFKTCMDGNFRISEITSPWDPRTIFAISLGFGSFDFAVAKGIDVAFDLIVGRGGQLLLGLTAYPVFTNVLLYSMETQSATYAYYAAVAFDTMSVSTMTQISKALYQRPKANRNLRTTTGLLFTSLYIVSFPTLASAATGYTTLQDPVVPLIGDERTAAPWPGAFRLCSFFIKDGDRIPELHSNACITADSDFFNPATQYHNLLDNNTLKNGPSKFGNTSLNAPPLTITRNEGYDLNGTHYSNQYLEERGYCRPNSNKYKWGFSYLLLFIIIILTYIWAAILTAMHVETRRKGRLARCGRHLGLYRAVLDLSRAIRLELGEDAQLLPNSELEKLLAEAKDGILYKVPEDTEFRMVGVRTIE